ncbi:uncharacterized protein LOC124670186 isoform X2 [Lolium rigidum]|uniref:uncharacterized protein LOC124670186 isoform X2 n=1 Tax=Lolium rigidum TaxID=89674 RepID=UPI001F5E04CD|nr:uncharacterized protein LOC124670186 isoform X2 [Lolium rigidum]
MVRFGSEDRAMGAIDRHGIHEVGGPLLVGGVNLLNTRTGLFYDQELRHVLTDEHRFRAYLEFREQAIKIAVTELMSGAKSPADLFLPIAEDIDTFNSELVEYILMRYTRHDGTSSILQRSVTGDDGHNGTEVENTSIRHYLPNDIIRQIENNQKLLCQQLSSIQRYFAYRKFLVKLDFIQSNSDPESVLKRLKSSTICPGLPDHELRRCLEGHINFLKEYEDKKLDPAASISEYENIALKKIHSELSSELQEHLDRYDWMLMEQYYDRMKLRSLARECATQAQMTGHVLVAEGLPIKAHLKKYMLSANPEVKKLPSFKQAAKLSFDSYMGRIKEKFRSRAPLGRPIGRPFQLLFAGTLATSFDDGNNEERYDPQCGMTKDEFEWRCAQVDRVSQRMPQAFEKLDFQLQVMRRHFLDDPDALNTWDEYENDVRYAYRHNLLQTLSSPLSIPNSDLYEQLMKRKAQSKTFVGKISGGLDKFKEAATRNKRLVGAGVIFAGAAAVFALGRHATLREVKQQTNEA